jgi:16S rRNA (uracil1498-N3)-methyltransferase
MRLTRSHVAMPLQVGAELALPEDALHHLVRVLRLREGDACVLFNGDGQDYAAVLVAIGKREATVRITGTTPRPSESPLAITLVQGVARGEKMDLILQKATELGVAAIVPVTAERTEVKLDAVRAAKRLAHWNEVIVAACEQCGRACLPRLEPPQPLARALASLPAAALGLVLDPNGQHRLGGLEDASAGRPLALAIGPEGGWAAGDLAVLAGAGFQGLRLGPRILRTETAGLAAIAALQARFGDLA